MNQKRTVFLAWGLCAVCVIAAIAQLIFWLAHLVARPTLSDAVDALGYSLAMPVLFSVLAALIIARHSGNRVGWLMMLVALATTSPISDLLTNLSAPPVTLTPGLWLLVWFDSWSWIPLVFPIFLIPLYFPNGQPPSPRWNWVNWLAFSLWLYFIGVVAFADTIGPLNGPWTLPNPIGFIPTESLGSDLFLVIFAIGLLTTLSSSVISLFVRYRRAPADERQQIKWLLFAVALFTILYATNYFTVIFLVEGEIELSGWRSLLGVLTILTLPVAIGIAILRHRLYDIDIIIRRTVRYTILTALLTFMYFGGVVIFQRILAPITGWTDAPIVTVVVTLGIAALFGTLRVRVQKFIDHRFYRDKYNAEQSLARFAATARDEVDMDKLTAALIGVVDETMQPDKISLWLKPAVKKSRS